MGRQRYRWAGCLALTAAVTVLLVIGRLSAQAPGQGLGSAWPTALAADEVMPALLAGPDGQVFRLWLNWIDLRTGGGGIVLALASPQGTWQKVLELLSSEPGAITTQAPAVAFGPSNEVALAYQWRRQNPLTKQIRLARSQDGGKTWIQSSTAIESSGKGFSPTLNWGRGGSLVVVWADERRVARAWDIYARRSPDGGGTWEPEQLVSRSPQETKNSDVSFAPTIIGDGHDRFWVVWIGLRYNRTSVYLSRSIDGAKTWTEPVALSGQSDSVTRPQLVRWGERLLLVWVDARTGKNRIYAVTSGDGGVTWSSPTRVDHVPADSQASIRSPSLAVGPDEEVFVTWSDGRNGRDDIFLGRSPDFGRTWAEEIRLDMDEPGTAVSMSPSIARAEDGRLAIAWQDDRAGHNGVYLRVRAAGPSPAWGPEVVVAPPGPKKGAGSASVLWGRGGALYVAWQASDYSQAPAITHRVDGRILFPDKN